jgi:hypothetical protein
VAVMFVDQTVGGMLVKRLQKAEYAIAQMVGYRVRMVETSGTQLCRQLPNTNPWSGQNCGRSTCYTCTQGDEKLQNCRQRNIMYESTCTLCNVDTNTEIKDVDKRFEMEKAVYVGESARSIFERAGEHRKYAGDAKEDSSTSIGGYHILNFRNHLPLRSRLCSPSKML